MNEDDLKYGTEPFWDAVGDALWIAHSHAVTFCAAMANPPTERLALDGPEMNALAGLSACMKTYDRALAAAQDAEDMQAKLEARDARERAARRAAIDALTPEELDRKLLDAKLRWGVR